MKLYYNTFRDILKGMLEKPMWALVLLSLCLMSLVYVNHTVWDLPVAVVDHDHSPVSNEISRLLDASPKIEVISYPSLDDAKRDLGWRRLFAIVVLPIDLEKKILANKPVSLPVYGDATNRLPNGQIQQNVAAAFQELLGQYETSILLKNGFSAEEAGSVLTPMKGMTMPLFNPGISFAAIIFPGMLVMLLQHTLLIASVRVLLLIKANGKPNIAVILGALTALLPIWLFLSIVLFALWPWVLGYRQTANMPEIMLLTFPFLLAVLGVGSLLTACLKKVEMIYLSLSFLTLPVFYISGTIWPLQAMPPAVRFISSMLPSTWAIKAIAGVNQLGLSFKDSLSDIRMLLVLFVLYSAVAIFISLYREGYIKQLLHKRT